MIENRNVNIITDADGKKLILINDIRFKGKRRHRISYTIKNIILCPSCFALNRCHSCHQRC